MQVDPEQRRKEWVSYLELRLKIFDVHVRARVEKVKLSVEYGKIIITNLHFINAGGIVSVPALVQFVGVDADRWVKLYTVGPAIILYVCGLFSASLSALVTYLNYQRWAQATGLGQVHDMTLLESNTLAFDTPEQAKAREERIIALIAEEADLTKKINSSYCYGHWAGWASFLFFVCGSVWLGYHLIQGAPITGRTLPRGAAPGYSQLGG